MYASYRNKLMERYDTNGRMEDLLGLVVPSSQNAAMDVAAMRLCSSLPISPEKPQCSGHLDEVRSLACDASLRMPVAPISSAPGQHKVSGSRGLRG